MNDFNQFLDHRVPLFSSLVILFFIVGGVALVQILTATERVKRGKPTKMTTGRGCLWALAVIGLFVAIAWGGK